MKRMAGLLVAGVAVLIFAPAGNAHFHLLEPASWQVENDLGNPQKATPCGTTAEAPGEPSGQVTQVTGGAMLHVKVQETVFHPGHYWVALAVNSRDELPADPDVTTRDSERGPWSVSAIIRNVAVPLLADGLWAHTDREAITEPFETDVELPNINCEKCTLQIGQFMAEHGRNPMGDFSYHHCADLRITADPAKPIDTRWPGQR